MWEFLGPSLVNVFSWESLVLVFGGAAAGLVFGALPGLSATMALAVLVPFTFTMPPTPGLILLGAVYMGAIYGGAFPAIMVNAPGTPSSIGTTFDGVPMMKQGRGEEAVVGVTFASVVGGIVGVLGLLFLSPILADISLRFGPPEYFWLAVFGLTIISSLASGSLLKAGIGVLFGLLIASIGVAPIGGSVRFTFGVPVLQGGIELIAALIGLFCLPEVFAIATRSREGHEVLPYERKPGVLRETVGKVFRMPWNLVRSSVIGTVVGILPGAGGNIANLVSYTEAKRASKHRDEFGKGSLEGVVAPEAANNAVVGGGLIPLLTLGIPGAPPDAIIYGALLMQGLRPGAELFAESGDITYTFILSIALAALAMLPIGLYLGRGILRAVTKVPASHLAPGILLMTILGSYAIRNNVFDVIVMFAFGVIGYLFNKLGFSPAPIVLGIILAGIAEEGLVQGMLMGIALDPNWIILFTRPLSWILIGLSIFALVGPFVANRMLSKARNRGKVSHHA